MAKFELKLPKMGESVNEATLISWLVEIGDSIAIDDGVVEVATDKVDTEIPSEVAGILVERCFDTDDVVKVGETIAIIETEGNDDVSIETTETIDIEENTTPKTVVSIPDTDDRVKEIIKSSTVKSDKEERFYSPLVRSIAQEENIGFDELQSIVGTGQGQRVTKNDILAYIENRTSETVPEPEKQASKISVEQEEQTPKVKEEKTLAEEKKQPEAVKEKAPIQADSAATHSEDEVIPMDRMGKLIAEHMIHSVQTSAHVQSFIEIDVTNIVTWRNKVKETFLQQTGEKLTFTPIFMQAVTRTLREFPMVNISVEGTNIVKKKAINLGMAAALPDGNLIVPVIKNADELSLVGMAKAVNTLAHKARTSQLAPEDIQGGTYTVTNVGSFGSITGTPIINQPQVAILALGAIRKMPAVIETPQGDFIGIRHKMIVAHSYDHRVVNGALGGQFILRLKEILEHFDVNTSI